MKQILYIFLSIFIFSCKGQTKESSQVELDKIVQADKLTDKGEYKEAIRVLDGVKSKEAAYLVGFSYLRLKDYMNAIQNFSLVYKNDPDYKNTCYNLAQCYLEKTEWQKKNDDKSESINLIINILTEGIELKTGKIPDNFLAQYYANRGQVFQINSEFEEAIEDFTKAVELDEQGDFYSRRAMTYHFMGKNNLACKDFEKGRALGETYNEKEIRKICP